MHAIHICVLNHKQMWLELTKNVLVEAESLIINTFTCQIFVLTSFRSVVGPTKACLCLFGMLKVLPKISTSVQNALEYIEHAPNMLPYIETLGRMGILWL